MLALRLISLVILAASAVVWGQQAFAQNKTYPDYCDNPRPDTPGWKWESADICIKKNLTARRATGMSTSDYVPPAGKRCYQLSIPQECVKPGMGFMKFATKYDWWPHDDVAEPKAKPDPPATAHVCQPAVADKLSADARGIYNFACNSNVRFSVQPNFGYVDIARTLKDEDGVRPLIRTGYEVELFKRLKTRALNLEAFTALPARNLFAETVYAIVAKDAPGHSNTPLTVSIPDVMLTARNVTIILARPEQWAGNYPMTPYGEDRSKRDRARGIFEDLLGNKSVDRMPTVFQFHGRRVPVSSGEFIVDAFFGKQGVFEYYPAASAANFPAHWNAGIHYYFWLGSMVGWLSDYTSGTSLGGFSGVNFAHYSELALKFLGNDLDRAHVQLENGFDEGATQSRRLLAAIYEIHALDPGWVSGRL